MPNITKVTIKINGIGSHIDLYFLHAYALHHYKEPYEKEDVRKQVNEDLRVLMENEDSSHPQIVHQKILSTLIAKKLKKELFRVAI